MHLQAGTRSEVVDDRVCSWLASELSMMRKAIERQPSVISMPWLGLGLGKIGRILLIRHHDRLE